jgi:hypothetical protein
MQNAHDLASKMERRFANQFNDSEYRRWSARIRAGRPLSVPSGITVFLDPNEDLQPGREDIPLSSVEIGNE